jgi:hypothetical protein
MEQPRRFIFHAHAAAFGGQIIRPRNIVLEAPGASALPVSGGRSVARIPRTSFDEFFSVDSARTFAEGLFDDAKQFEAFTNHQLLEQSLTASTVVRAEVLGLAVGRTPRLTIKRLSAELQAKSPNGSGQPAVRVGKDVAIEGVVIDGHRLVVELYTAPFQRFDTYAKLQVAADDPAFVKESGDALFMTTTVDGQAPPAAAGRLLQSSPGTVYATIVRSIRWDGDPFPGSEINRNVVKIPGLGVLYFGELLIEEYSRRLTMLRLALGSEAGGVVACADVQDNGGWSF